MGTERALVLLEPLSPKLKSHKILKGHFPGPYKDL